jgi:hypothetical protein
MEYMNDNFVWDPNFAINAQTIAFYMNPAKSSRTPTKAEVHKPLDELDAFSRRVLKQIKLLKESGDLISVNAVKGMGIPNWNRGPLIKEERKKYPKGRPLYDDGEELFYIWPK